MFEAYVDKMRPVAAAAAAEARAYANAILIELRGIRDTVADTDNVIFTRHTPNFTNLPGGESPGVDTAPQHDLNVAQSNGNIIPGGEEWELEFLSGRALTATGTLVLYRNSVRCLTLGLSTGGQTPTSGNNFRFQAGDVVTYAIAGAGALTAELYLQFRVKKIAAPRDVRSAPAWESPTATVVTTPGDDVTHQQTLPRHQGTYFHGINPVGTMKAEQNGTL